MAPSTIECWGAGDGIIDIVKFIIDEDKYYEDEEKAHQYMEKNYEEWGDYDTQRNILIDIKDTDHKEILPDTNTCNGCGSINNLRKCPRTDQMERLGIQFYKCTECTDASNADYHETDSESESEEEKIIYKKE